MLIPLQTLSLYLPPTFPWDRFLAVYFPINLQLSFWGFFEGRGGERPKGGKREGKNPLMNSRSSEQNMKT
jgi:hypothetical protein